MKQKHLLAVICAAVSALSMAVFFNQRSYAEEEDFFTVSAPAETDGNTITTPDGQKWSRVKSLDDNKSYVICVKKSDGTEVMLSAGDGQDEEYIWRYYRRNMVASTYSKFSYLSTPSHYLSCIDGKLSFRYWESTIKDLFWSADETALIFREDENTYYLKYDENAETQFSMTTDRSEAAEVSVYTKGDTLERCIKVQPCSENYVTEGSGYAAPEFSVTLSDAGIITDNVVWNVDGNDYDTDTLSFTAGELAGREAGVHRISCIIEGHDDKGIIYREKSSDALFVIAKGVIPDSFISFSDVHEEYHLIGNAIETTMNRTGGYIPGLIICTSDLVNGPTPDSDYMLGHYYPLIKPHLGGIDTVFVSGNHDPGKAASEMSVKADLGAAKDLSASGGLIFDGRSDAVRLNGTSSLSDGNIKVFGINYEAAAHRNVHDYRYYSYDSVIDSTKKFLEETAKDYNGELIVISAHSGLHVLGMDPASVNRNGNSISDWIGENAYNIDMSYELASLINSCAEQYDMNIIWLFGHDHSRQETEMFLTEGDTLTSPVKYTEQSFNTLPLHFTYAHAGYLSTSIGSADSSFCFVQKNDDKYSFDLIRTYDNTVRHTEFADIYTASLKSTETTAPAETAPLITEQAATTETSAADTVTEPAVTAPAVSENGTETVSSDVQTSESKKETEAVSSQNRSPLPETGRNAPAVPALTGSALILLFLGASAVKKSGKK